MQHQSPAVPAPGLRSKRHFTTSHPAPNNGEWRLATRIGFRFACVFLLLVIIPFPFEHDDAPDVLPSLWHRVVPWVASHVSTYSQPQVLGSDELYGYFQLVTYVLIAIAVTILWSVADRKRRDYGKLYEWVQLYVRIYVAAVVFSYGSAKIFPEQFRSPSLARLLQPFGDYQPSGLMWAFMGVSRTYTLFAGAVEALAGLLLFVPRLRTLGAMLCGAALTNVFVLDMSYDVSGPRTHCFILLLMCGFLLAPDLGRLTEIFVLNRSIEPVPARPLFRKRWLNAAVLAAQLAYGAYIVAYNLAQDSRNAHTRDQALAQNSLRGIWYVDEFQEGKQVRTPLITDPVRWQRIIIDSPPSATLQSGVIDLLTIQSMSGSLRSLPMELDRGHSSLLLRTAPGDKTWAGQFKILRQARETLVLEGQLDGRQIEAKLHLTRPQFRITSSGFHWLHDHTLDPWNP